jgi:hypothetical protein
MLKPVRPLVAAAAAAAALAAVTAPAQAADPTGEFAPFKYCPYTNPDVQSCLHSLTTSGSFKLGNSTVPVSAPITLQGGFTLSEDALTTTFFPAVGADTLSKTKLTVPGGLIGIVSTDPLTGPLLALFYAVVDGANGVKATAELVGPVEFNYLNFVIGSGTVMTLPLRVRLENPFLGPNCYIGAANDPVTLNLTAGTTSPPPPNQPISGSVGTITTNPDATVVTAAGVRLVDNAFAVPRARGCGSTFIDQPLVTAAVNLKNGLPSAAGNNHAILEGTTKVGDRAAVQASAG